jgi:hypothetical protein
VSDKLTLEEVLDEFAAAADRPSEALVRKWTGMYPEFEREIVDFATEWAATEFATADATLEAELEDRLVARTMSHIQQVAHQFSRQAKGVPDAAVEAQIQRVEAAYWARAKQPSFLANLGIDETMLALFEEHMILPPVPRRLLDAWSSALNLGAEGVEAVSAWLFQRNRPTMASYASKTPDFVPWTFQQAVENSTLSAEAKQQWLREHA